LAYNYNLFILNLSPYIYIIYSWLISIYSFIYVYYFHYLLPYQGLLIYWFLICNIFCYFIGTGYSMVPITSKVWLQYIFFISFFIYILFCFYFVYIISFGDIFHILFRYLFIFICTYIGSLIFCIRKECLERLVVSKPWAI